MPTHRDPSKLRPTPWLVGLLLLAAAIHIPVLSSQFPLDDGSIARTSERPQNRMVRELRPLSDYLSTEYWSGAGTPSLPSNPLYRPVTVYSLALTHHWWPGRDSSAEAYPHHAINLLLHVLAVLLTFALIRRLTQTAGPALCGALVFAVHAMHVDVVAPIVGRADLLAYDLGAAAAWIFAAAVAPRKRVSRAGTVWRASVSAALLLLAFGSKESALAWIGFLPIYAIAAGYARTRLGTLIGWTATVAALPATVWFALRANAFTHIASQVEVAYLSNPLFAAPPLTRILTAIQIWGYGLYKTLFPFTLASDYGPSVFPLVESPADLGFLAAAICLLAMASIGVFAVRTNHVLALAIASWLGLTFLTTNVPLPIGVQFAERLYYLGSLGLSLLAAWLAMRVHGTIARRVGVGALAVWCAASAVQSHLRCYDWRDNPTLFVRDAASQPRSLGLQLKAAIVERDRGRRDRFEQHLRAALAIEPEFGRAYGELGAVRLQQKRFDEAERLLRRGLACKIPLGRSERAQILFNLGFLLAGTGRTEEARRRLAEAARAAPMDSTVRHRVLWVGLGLLPDDEFVAILTDGERLTPTAPYWRAHRARLAFRAHDYAAAATGFAASLPAIPAGQPGVRSLWLDYAESLARTGRKAKAIRTLERLRRDRAFAKPPYRATVEARLRALR